MRSPFVLEALQLDERLLDAAETLEPRQRDRQLLDRLDEDAALLDGVPRRRLDAVELEQVADLLDVVDDVVELGRELVDVLAVERRHVLRVQQRDQLARDLVAGRLGRLHVRLGDRGVGVLAEACLGLPGSLERVRAGAGEEVVELGRTGDEAQAHEAAVYQMFTTPFARKSFTASLPPARPRLGGWRFARRSSAR